MDALLWLSWYGILCFFDFYFRNNNYLESAPEVLKDFPYEFLVVDLLYHDDRGSTKFFGFAKGDEDIWSNRFQDLRFAGFAVLDILIYEDLLLVRYFPGICQANELTFSWVAKVRVLWSPMSRGGAEVPPKDSKPAQRPQVLPNAGVLWGPRLNSDWDLTFWRKLLETPCCFRAHGEICRTPSCREMICSPHSGGGQSWWVICESKAFFVLCCLVLEQGRLDGSARFDLCTDSAESNRNFRAIAGGWRRAFAGFPTCFPHLSPRWEFVRALCLLTAWSHHCFIVGR